MKLNRLIFNQNTYKMSNKRICKNIQVELPDQLIKKNTLNMIHKLVVKRETDSIAKRIRIQRHMRMSSKISLNLNLKTKKAKRSILYKGIKMYNAIPANLKTLSVSLFKKRLKKYHINDVPDD